MSKWMRATVVASLLGAAVCLGGCPLFPPKNSNQFTSAETGNSYRGEGQFDGLAPGADLAAEGEGEVAPREVVEPDVIRRSGNLLFILNQYRGLTLVDLDTETIVAQVPTYGYPRDLYVSEGRAYVLVGYATDCTPEGNTLRFDVQARLYVVDVTAPAEASIVSQFDLDGDLVDSRMVGDVLYAVCAEFQWYWAESGVGADGSVVTVGTRPAEESAMGMSPSSGAGAAAGKRVGVAACQGMAKSRKIVKQQTSSSWVTSVNIADPGNIYEADSISFAGYGNVIQASDTGIFVASPDWDWWGGGSGTTITYVNISDAAGGMAVQGSVTVNGYVADRFKMDAYNGVLRVVSGGWWDDRKVYITTVDLSLLDSEADQDAVLGTYELEDAIGETLFATRFDGDKAYIVSYFLVDPLFVVDLSDARNPTVAGTLTVPGWSTHIEPMGDRLIALGVDDTDGRRVCVSLFDVSDPARLSDPDFNGLIDRVTFGEDWSWSSAYSDVKAFTVLDDLLIVPFSGWSYEAGGYNRLQFITYNENDLEAKGTVDLQGDILRSFEYGDKYYSVTTEQLATIDASNLDALEVTHRLTLAEYVADFLELSPEVAAEIVISYDTAATLVRTLGPENAVLGEVSVPMDNLTDTHAYGNAVVLVGADWGVWGETDWADPPHYEVVVVDCSDPAAPAVGDIARVEMEPSWDWWYWYGGYGPEMLVDKGATKQMGLSWRAWYPTRNTFLVGDSLVLRGHADTFDSYFGEEETAYQGLAVVDLTDPALPYVTVGLAFQQVASLDQAGGKLYLGTQVVVEQLPPFEWWWPLCAYYVQEISVSPLTIGPAANVPGTFVQYDAGRDILTLRDFQWVANNMTGYLRTVRWDGGEEVEELGDLSLPASASQVLGRGEKVFLDGYDNGYTVYAVSVGSGGELTLGEGVMVTDQWGTLLDAHGNSAYINAGNVIARYDFSEAGRLADVVEVMGYPLKMRFGTEKAFAILGYVGVAELSL